MVADAWRIQVLIFVTFWRTFFLKIFIPQMVESMDMKSQLYVQKHMFSLKSFQLIQQLIKSYQNHSGSF